MLLQQKSEYYLHRETTVKQISKEKTWKSCFFFIIQNILGYRREYGQAIFLRMSIQYQQIIIILTIKIFRILAMGKLWLAPLRYKIIKPIMNNTH